MKNNKTMNTPVIETKPPRKKFDKAFKQRAVELWLTSGKAATEVAAELGFHAQRLSAWRKRFAPPTPGERIFIIRLRESAESLHFLAGNSAAMGTPEPPLRA
ncbi:MAG: transposase [Verrucomicrobiota bacterium]